MISNAYAEQFQPALTDTTWATHSSPILCSLSQPIDGFGEAKFSQIAGKPFTLTFSTLLQPSSPTELIFEVAEAPWQNSEQRNDIKIITVEQEQQQFSIDGISAQQALNHIKEGRFPTIYYQGLHSNEPITVLMSTIHLSDYLPEFEQCLRNILPYSFEDISKLTLNFETEKAELGHVEKQALQKVAAFVNADNSIRQIRISGHTDNHGRRRLNAPLSEARAVVVKNYLVDECQVSEQLIITESHLEFSPMKSNKTPQGRAYNRRAELRVIR